MADVEPMMPAVGVLIDDNVTVVPVVGGGRHDIFGE